MKNFYPEQYNKDKSFGISHNYLSKQFEDYDDIFEKIIAFCRRYARYIVQTGGQ